jgi:hypothetical protein
MSSGTIWQVRYIKVRHDDNFWIHGTRGILLTKKLSETSGVATGTEYRSTSMDFKKAKIALQSLSLSAVVSADFSHSGVT